METQKGKRLRTPGRSLCPQGVGELRRRKRPGALGGSSQVGLSGELQNLSCCGRAGTQRAENRESCTSQPRNSSQTVALTREWDRGTKRSLQKPCVIEGGPRVLREAQHTNLCSSHKPLCADRKSVV